MTTAARAPERAEGLELLGALSGSGYDEAPSLVRRPDGQSLQLTPLLYALLEEVDGRRGPEELASSLGQKAGREVTAEDVQALLQKLEPLGLLEGSEPTEAVVSNPLLGLRWKVVASSPDSTRRITAPFAFLFNPLILWPVLAAFVGVCWFVLMDKGLASATRQAFDSPGLLLGVFALGVLSAGFHELGHAAACRYGGATPGAMGAGIYLVWPAFYTNVDDSYRLSKRGRLRVDFGGLYFNALVAVAVTGIWLVTQQDALLLGVALQLLQMLRQLAPIIRADGYHILSDLTGVPDLFMHLGPTLRGMLPWHWRDPSPLTRRARVIVTTWVLVVVPLLLVLIVGAVLLLPRLLATAWLSGKVHGSALLTAAEDADVLGAGAAALKLFALALPVLGTLYLLTSITRRVVRSTWQHTEDRPVRRAFATTLGVALIAGLLWAWWPAGQYQPVRADERGTLVSLVSNADSRGETVVPTEQVPALAMIPRSADRPALLMVQGEDGIRTVLTSQDGGAAAAFPFTMPRAPGEGDNQALAVNSTDGSTVYDVAYVLVTITDGAPVTSTNSAYALASCTGCTTVAVAFQVVLVIGQSDVIVPINTAVAANSGCIQCVTTALAIQLVATLKEAPSEEVQAQLDAAMAQLGDLEGLDAGSLLQQVKAVEESIITILETNGLLTNSTTTTTSTASATPAPSGAPEPTPSATPSAEPAPSPSPSETPTPEPSPSP